MKEYDFDPERHKFVVTIDHSYYPDVLYCATRDEATIAAQRLMSNENVGQSYSRRPAVVIAEIVSGYPLGERDEMGRHVEEVL